MVPFISSWSETEVLNTVFYFIYFIYFKCQVGPWCLSIEIISLLLLGVKGRRKVLCNSSTLKSVLGETSR